MMTFTFSVGRGLLQQVAAEWHGNADLDEVPDDDLANHVCSDRNVNQPLVRIVTEILTPVAAVIRPPR